MDNIIHIIHNNNKTEFYKKQMEKSLIVFKIPFEEPAWLLVLGSRVSSTQKHLCEQVRRSEDTG